MKKLIVTLVTVLFLGSTTGLVFAQTGTAPSTTPVAKSAKKKVKKVKKVKKAAAPAASTTTPVAK